MQYIPLDLFKRIFTCSTDQELMDQRESLREKFRPDYLEEIRKELNNHNISFTDVMAQLDALRNDANPIFHQWIQQSPNLKAILLGKELKACDFRQQIIAEHFLFPKFRSFVSPFLCTALLSKLKADQFDTSLNASGYLPLLKEADQSLIQENLEAQMTDLWKSLQTKLTTNLPEKELIREFARCFSDQQVKLLNAFTKSFYYVRINWINQAVELLSYKGTTYRLAYWLVGQLKKLELNPEHNEQITEIAESVRLGDGRYFSKKSLIESQNPGLRIALWIFFTLVLCLGIFMFDDIAHWFASDPIDNTKTSFEQFTVAERKQIDSLMKTMEQHEPNETGTDGLDQYLHLTPVMLPIVDRDHFKNKKAQTFVDDCFKAMRLTEAGRIDSCSPYPENKLLNLDFNGFTDLDKNKGSKQVFLRNGSDYTLLVLVFDNVANEGVYIRVFSPQDELSFEVDAGQQLLILPGLNLGRFASSAVKIEQPSEDYEHHFCFMDENFEHRLSDAYVVKDLAQKSFKLLANQTPDGEFYIVDIDGALEE